MRILNRSHIPWFLFVLLASAAAGWIYVGNFSPARLPAGAALPSVLIQKVSDHRSIGGTPVGLAFGIISFAIFIFGVLLSLRKRLLLWPIGSVQSWMRAHIWLTLLTIPLVLLHSGFRWGGPMTVLLVVLYAVVMLSGIYGLILQHQLPAIMKERLPAENVYEQIPYVRSRLVLAAEQLRDDFLSPIPSVVAPVVAHAVVGEKPIILLADAASEADLAEFLERQVLPYLRARRGGSFRLSDQDYSDDLFRSMNLSVNEGYRDQVAAIQAWCEERRMLDLQIRFHHWLHGWLFVHVPLSFLLLLLTAWHAVVTVLYY
ncbi:MAG: hypothetical protein H0X40_18030 [Chthoniobacterales bacterium]|nr:hypothetical protein [Chthoniobacterales bacterium]